MTSPPTKDLTKLAVAEGSFRNKAVGYIISIVKGPDIPMGLKSLTVITLTLFVLFSFQFCILILHILCAVAHITGKVEPIWYVGLFGTEWITGTAIAIPLIPRLGSFGESKRLEEQLERQLNRRSDDKKVRELGHT